jgi:hypothetical protein
LGRYFCSRVIRVSFEIGEKERLATGFLAAAIWFHRHKYGINLGKRRGVVTLQNPAFFGSTIFIKNAEVERLLPIRPTRAPGLECAGLFKFGVPIQVPRSVTTPGRALLSSRLTVGQPKMAGAVVASVPCVPDVGQNTIHANDGSSQTRSAVRDHLRECYLDRVTPWA